MFDKASLNKLYQYAMVLCQQPADAYDLLQGAMEKYLIEVRCQKKTIHNPEAFIRRLIRNRFIDQYRYNQRWDSELFEEETAYDISPLSLEDICVSSDELGKIWQVLSPQERDIFYHWAVLGHSTDQACELLDMPRGTFLARIHRVRKTLKLHFNRGNQEGQAS